MTTWSKFSVNRRRRFRKYNRSNCRDETETEVASSIMKDGEISIWKLKNQRRPFPGIIVHGGGDDDGEAAELRRRDDSEDDPKFRKSSPLIKKKSLFGSVSSEIFALKAMKRLTKQRAMAVMFELDSSRPLGSWASLAREFANQLPATSFLLAIDEEKTILNDNQLKGFQLDLRTEFYFSEVNAMALNEDSEFEASNDDRDGGMHSRNGKVNSHNTKALLSSISVVRRQLPEPDLGWPFRRRNYSAGQEVVRKLEARNVSVVQWVMGLPDRSRAEISKDLRDIVMALTEPSFTNEFEGINEASSLAIRNIEGKVQDRNVDPKDCHEHGMEVKHEGKMVFSISFVVRELQQETPCWNTVMKSGFLSEQPRLPIRMNQSVFRWFSYAELQTATSEFSSENLIGVGGYSTVYKGYLPNGNSVVVKVLKSYMEALESFVFEINLVSSIKHRSIAPLIGVCIENERLISVYDYFSEGSLEENLHGYNGRCKIEWEVRFKVAVAIAEALNYLHNECSPPVIHRDVKSSNILLSKKFQAQLSDFGLAICGPTDSSYIINSDVVGTFGYIAPEYLMQGRVSDKIDVYAYGIVLLELLSGRRPIDFTVAGGQGSLVLWAREVLNSENPQALIDTELDMDFNDLEVQRMITAATLCINQSARLRPNLTEILKLLKGEKHIDEYVNFNTIASNSKELSDQNDDDVFPKFSSKLSLSFALRDIDNNCTLSNNTHTTSNTAAKPTRRLKLREYLNERQE